MTRFHFAALLAIAAVPVAAQAQPDSFPIQPSVDTLEERRALSAFSTCLAESRRSWARQLLAHPYLSERQAFAASQALGGRDGCMVGNGETEMTFRTSGVSGSLAEHFVRAEIGRVDMSRLARTLATLDPLNASEDFALCVAARNPQAARELALSAIGGADENRAARSVATNIPPCTNDGEDLTVDVQALRALMATALYRATSTTSASRD